MMHLKTLTLSAITLALTHLAPPLRAQDLGPKAAAQSGAIAIEGAFIHSVDGKPDRVGDVWFVDGILRGVGDAGDPIPATAERIDGRGKHVYPGLIGAHTQLGLQEISAVRATNDVDEVGDMTPEVRAAVAINPDSAVIPVTRQNGVLVVGVFPTGGFIPGRGAVVQLEGWTWEDMAKSQDCGVVINWPRASRSKDGLEDAANERRSIDAEFRRARAVIARRAADPSQPHDIRAEALASVLAGERTTWIRADTLEQITSAIGWAKSLGLKPALIGARDAGLCLDLILEHDVAVVVTGIHRLPARRDAPVDATFTLPLTLEEARVRWCLASSEPFYNERNLPYHAAKAVAHGLSREAAIRAITRSAAEILGVGDQLGSLEVGKEATLIVTSGDPLEIRTRVEMAFVGGRRSSLESKQTKLAEKYRRKYLQKRGETDRPK